VVLSTDGATTTEADDVCVTAFPADAAR
jgi:hypothetical protein